MKKILCMVLAFLLLALCGCTQPAEPTQPSETVKKEEPQDDTVAILFIGNKYTSDNEMPTEIFQKMAEDAGYTVRVSQVICSSYKLLQFVLPGKSYTEQVDAELTVENQYDFVVIQEQTTCPFTAAEEFYSAVRVFNSKIRNAGATPILFSAWSYKEDNKTLQNNGWTVADMTWRLDAANRAIGYELGIDVAHVGLAFKDICSKYSMLDLYANGGINPSYMGSYLAAATLFATIFEEDPTTLTFTGDLTDRQAEVLLEAAGKATFETPEVPKEYKTSSAGVQSPIQGDIL